MKKGFLIGCISLCLIAFLVIGTEHTNKVMNNCLEEHTYNYCKGLYE